VGITNRIVLHEAGMNTWDRGFDATGNQQGLLGKRLLNKGKK